MTPLIRNAADELVEAYPPEEEDVTLYLPGWTARDLLDWKYGQDVSAISEILNLVIVKKKGLKNIERLILSNTNITKITGLENFPNLKDLDLRGCGITEISGLETLVNLEKLDLSRNKITEISGLETLVNLEKLDITDNEITEITGLENLTNLKELDLTMNQISKIEGLKTLTHLEELNLHGNEITEIPYLENLANLTNLKWINFRTNKISNSLFDEIESLIIAESIPNFLDLDLSKLRQMKIDKIKKMDNMIMRLNQGVPLLIEELYYFAKHASPEMVDFYIRSPKTHSRNKDLLAERSRKRRAVELKGGFKIYK
ncbi:MAG: leucine-rich repeat protein [Promethearchaeota archaeon]